MTHAEYELGKNLEKTCIEQESKIAQLTAEYERLTREREGYRLLALLIYDWVCRYRDAKMKMYSQGGVVSNAAFTYLPASEGPMEGFVRTYLGTPYNSSGLTENVNDVAKTIEAQLKGVDRG